MRDKLAALDAKTGNKPNMLIFLMDEVGWMASGPEPQLAFADWELSGRVAVHRILSTLSLPNRNGMLFRVSHMSRIVGVVGGWQF